jgi:hypothetical protein
MKLIAKPRFAKLWIMVLLAAMSPVSFSARSFAVTIGEHYGGGIVFYVDATGQHGLIAAETDIYKPHIDMWGDTFGSKGFSFRWSTGEYKNADAPDYANGALGTGSAIGTGRSNTKKILRKYPASYYPNSAAALASSYSGGGKNDWFLPSKDELNELYVQYKKGVVGVFADDFYWSSSEYTAGNAWDQYFVDGFQYLFIKTGYSRVRAVRAF